MLRKQIVQKHVSTKDIQHVIGHHGSVFVKITIRTILFLFVLYVIFLALKNYLEWEFLPWVFALVGLLLFVKYVIDFLNIYLDSMILSDQGVTFFVRDGLLEYKTDFFEWDQVETVSHAQNSFWDKVFARGDLIIKLEHVEYPFDNTVNPKKQVDIILKLKDAYGKSPIKNSPSLDEDKISILAEALGEVVKEYIDKKERSQ